MSWILRPTPGEMKICGSCPHRRGDARREFRCAQTYHHPYLPPLVAFSSDGAGYCTYWPPPRAQDEHQPELPLEAATA